MTGLEIEVFGEVVITVGKDILGLRSSTDNFCVALHIHCGRFAGAIKNREYSVTFILAGNDIDAILEEAEKEIEEKV